MRAFLGLQLPVIIFTHLGSRLQTGWKHLGSTTGQNFFLLKILEKKLILFFELLINVLIKIRIIIKEQQGWGF